MQKPLYRHASIVGAALLVLTACAEQTVTGATEFANTAIAYQRSLPPLLDESFEVQLERNSLELMNIREVSGEDTRKEVLAQQDQLMSDTFATTQQIKRQIELLESVFMAMLALAQSDADSRISEASSSLLAELDTTTKNAANLDLLNRPDFADRKDRIGNIIDRGASLAVAQFKSAALRNFLEDHGPTILVSLGVQEELLKVISERLKAYGEAELQEEYFEEVFLPYVEDGRIDVDGWTTNRLKHYAARVDLERVSAAATAAANVRTAFVALSENRLTFDSIDLIIADIARIQEFLSAVKQREDNSET